MASSPWPGGVRRRTIALAAALVMGTTTLAACSGEPAPKPTPTVTETTSVPGPTVLTFSVFGPDAVLAAYTRIAADFTAEHPEIVVNVRPYEGHAQASEAIVAGETPDVFLAERSDLPRLSQNDRIEPVDSLLIEEGVDFGDGFQREALEAFSADNSLLCMPVDTSPLVVYYNKRRLDLGDLTEEGEAPITAESGWSMEEFSEAARMTSRGKVKGLYVDPSLDQIAPFIWSGGGTVVDELEQPTTLTLSEDDSEEALEPLLELVRDPNITFSQEQIERASAVERFKVGRLTMMLGYRGLTPVLRTNPNLDFDVMPMPRLSRRATTGTMNGLCVGASSEHPQAAAQFIAYAVSDGPASLLAATGYVTPTNLDVANSEAFQQLDQKPVNSDVFTTSARYIQRLPAGEGWQHVTDLADRMLTRLFYDPVIDPLNERLARIDERSAQVFARFAPPEETPSESPSESPSDAPTGTPSPTG